MGRQDQLFTLQVNALAADQRDQAVYIRMCLFKDVRNASVLRQMLLDKQIECALIRAELIIEPFQVLTAATRAAQAHLNQKATSTDIHKEIVYALSPTRNITQSLSTFGIHDGSTNLLLLVYDDKKGGKMSKAVKHVDGRAVPLAQLNTVADYDLVKKVYHVKDPELNKMSIDDAIVTRIVAKDYVA